jgi:dGTPase
MSDYFKFTEDETRRLMEVMADSEARLSEFASKPTQAVRRYKSPKYGVYGDFIRSNYAVDVDKIIHTRMFNRGTDKTQVFSFFHNDDITRRSAHVQLVSRIARIIGQALGLNLDLIEAIAIGHDIGHTPFGHKGEEFLSALYQENDGRFFNHNVHSVRILENLPGCNPTLQTLDGILCHNGEKKFTEYRPAEGLSFERLDEMLESCYTQERGGDAFHPGTMEGCVVRISDIIAYLGKDRQDAENVKLKTGEYAGSLLGNDNSVIITRLITNVLKNSMGQPFIKLDDEIARAVDDMRRDNNAKIYAHADVSTPYYEYIKPMMEKLFYRLLEDVNNKNTTSPIYLHHICGALNKFYTSGKCRGNIDIVVDFIASMTDDYFVEIFRHLFPDDPLADGIRYVGYFDDRYM